jgi:hypothetical protein
MAIEIINKTGYGFPITRRVDSSADHASLPNSCYFEQTDLNNLVRYKDAGGSIVDAYVSKYDRLQDYVDPYLYLGYASKGSLLTNAVWTITRVTNNLDGTTVESTLTNVKWSDRLILIF